MEKEGKWYGRRKEQSKEEEEIVRQGDGRGKESVLCKIGGMAASRAVGKIQIRYERQEPTVTTRKKKKECFGICRPYARQQPCSHYARYLIQLLTWTLMPLSLHSTTITTKNFHRKKERKKNGMSLCCITKKNRKEKKSQRKWRSLHYITTHHPPISYHISQ